MKTIKTKQLVLLSLFICIEIILAITPLGYIPIGPVRATTLHIPVILAGIVLGKKQGAICGLVFGISSVIINTIQPTPTSFIFSPFYSLGEFNGNFNSLIIAIVPRVLMGYMSGVIFNLLKNKINSYTNVIISSVISSITNSFLVLAGIYVFFGQAYADVKEIAFSGLIDLLMYIILTNSIVEAIVGTIIILAIYKAIKNRL